MPPEQLQSGQVMSNRAMADVLSAQADKLIQEQRDAVERPDWSVQELESLVPLMRLAERTQQALTPVEPSPAFVHRLGKQLVSTTTASRKAVTGRTRKSILVIAAALGSFVSLASAVGLIIYLVRHRSRPAPV